MNIEPMPAETVRAAEKSCKGADGKALCDAANTLLQCKDTPVPAGVETVNGAPILNRILKKLQEDPYRCLEWTDSVDPASGAVYYTHSVTGETQWERPFDFVPIVREELYTTPQARFIKSILSPKRSHANMNHVMSGGVSLPNVGPPRAA